MSNRLRKADQLLAAGNFVEAEKCCRSLLKLGQDVVGARRILANCLYNRSVALLGHPSLHGEAEALLRESLSLDPAFALALNNLGSLLLITHRPAEAVEFLARATKIKGASTSLRENLAAAQQEAGMLEAASATLCQLAADNPSENAAYLLREALLMSAVPAGEGEVRVSRENTLAKLALLAERDDLSVTDPLAFPSSYFRFTYHGYSNAELNAQVAKIYASACPSLCWCSPHIASWQRPRGRIRIGIVSGFLRAHSIGNTSRGFVEMLDREHFEVIVIRLGSSTPDAVSLEIDASADRVVELSAGSLKQAREEIAKQELDVLFYQDIGMEPFSYFLAFARLAPVQFTSFGHPDTTGIPNVDYFVSSALYELPEAQSHYTERLVHIPDAGTLSYYHRPSVKEFIGREQFGFPVEARIYCCPQMLFKIQPAMDALFLGIIERDPLALVVLIEPAEKHWRLALEARLAKCAARLRERVVFLPAMPYDRFLNLLRVSDVVLDSVPFNGQNTTLESFAMGVPVVSQPGKRQCERHGYGLYKSIGFSGLLAESATDYVDLAVRVANEPAFRESCVARIQAGLDGLFRNAKFIRDFEVVVKNLVERAVTRRDAPDRAA